MTIKEAVAETKKVTRCAFDSDWMVKQIDDLEQMIQLNILLIASDSLTRYTSYEEDCDKVLLVRPPYDRIYVEWLIAQIDLRNGEYDKYAVSHDVFNARWQSYSKWVALRLRPAGGQAVWQGYYIVGPEGKGLQVLGLYSTLAKLRAAVPDPEIGDAYGVGSTVSSVVYIYTRNGGGEGVPGWQSFGSLKGAQGNPGKDGFTPYIGADGCWWLGEESTGVLADPSALSALTLRAETAAEEAYEAKAGAERAVGEAKKAKEDASDERRAATVAAENAEAFASAAEESKKSAEELASLAGSRASAAEESANMAASHMLSMENAVEKAAQSEAEARRAALATAADRADARKAAEEAGGFAAETEEIRKATENIRDDTAMIYTATEAYAGTAKQEAERAGTAAERAVEEAEAAKKEIEEFAENVLKYSVPIVQTTGDSETEVMSQKAVKKSLTEILNLSKSEIAVLSWDVGGLLADNGSMVVGRTNRATSGLYYATRIHVDIPDGVFASCYVYGHKGTYLGRAVLNSGGSYAVNIRDAYPEATTFRLTAGYLDDRVIEDVEVFGGNITVRVFDGQDEMRLNYKNGGIHGTTGLDTTDGKRIRTADFIPVQDLLFEREMHAETEGNIKYAIYFYDENQGYIGYTGWVTEKTILSKVADENTAFFRIVIAETNDKSISIGSGLRQWEDKLHLYFPHSEAYQTHIAKTNADDIKNNTDAIEANADAIKSNAKAIEANADAIEKVRSKEITRLYTDIDVGFTQGGITTSDGAVNGWNNKRIKSKGIKDTKLWVTADSDVKVGLFFWGGSKYLGSASWLDKNDVYAEDYAPEGTTSVRILMAYADDAIVEDVADLFSKIRVRVLEIPKEPEYVSDVPENMGVLNTILNAKQLHEIEFYTEAVLPQQMGDYEAHTWHKGMPYSSSRPEGGYVPNNVSLYTFMTALKNPNSYLYTVDLGDIGNPMGDTYYGVVCSTYCCYALGIVPSYTTHQWDHIPGMELVEHQSVYGLKLGDTIVGEAHVLIVTDITRNNRGRIGQITLMDAQVDKVRSTTFSPERFTVCYPTDKYKFYRYKKIYATEHTQSPFVAVEDETPRTFTYNTAIIPRKGDKANWLQGVDVEIDVLEMGSYTGVEIHKDDALLETKEIAELITLSGLEAGSYKARLTDGTNASDWCYWIVTDAVSSAADAGDGKVNVSFSSSNATPMSIQWMAASGNGTLWRQVLTEEEVAAGQAVGHYKAGQYKVRVAFKTEYGIVHSELPEAITVL